MKYIKDADVNIHKTEQPQIKNVTLWGNDYLVYDDDWRTHLHVVCTHKCNGSCWFCIEKESPRDEIDLSERLSYVCSEMQNADILKTVSFTGGEPTLCKNLERLVGCVDKSAFTTMNTNGRELYRSLNIGLDWVNLSRHGLSDDANDSIVGFNAPTLKELYGMPKTETKLRIQVVVDEHTDVRGYIELARSGACDDLSFRSLMLDGSHKSKQIHSIYRKMINHLLWLGSNVVEQEIQDYYIYEVHELFGTRITFSYSDMQTLFQDERLELDNFVKEFILRPDGGVYNSWKIGNRVILKPEQTA